MSSFPVIRSVSCRLPPRRKLAARRGLTLLELVVVMAILAALAAILVPLMPNLLRRAHKSTDATQSSELAKAVQLYQAANFSYPDRFDLLTTGTTDTYPDYLATDGGKVFGGFVGAKPAKLTTDELKALGRAGINFVQPMAASSSSPTLNPYADPPTPIDLRTETEADSPATYFAVLDTIAINNNLLLSERKSDSTAKYVLFGVGSMCSLVGQGIQDAPISTPQNKDLTPDTKYCRFGVIFKVSGTEVNKTERARFVAAVALEDDELEATEKDVIGYYEVSRDPRVN